MLASGATDVKAAPARKNSNAQFEIVYIAQYMYTVFVSRAQKVVYSGHKTPTLHLFTGF